MTIKTRIRNSLTAIAVGVTALAAFAGTATAAQTASKVTIEAEGGGFHGYVKSSKAKCKADRTVYVYEQAGTKQSPSTDERVLMDTTSPSGEWDTGNPGIREGRFYARVTRSPGCKPASSITVSAQE